MTVNADRRSKAYTPEVLDALRAQGKALPEQPASPQVPEGHVRYHVAVEQTLSSGVAPAATVAAQLRALADQLDPPRRPMRLFAHQEETRDG